jgi:nucleotide-binding universal stress UspA family protein
MTRKIVVAFDESEAGKRAVVHAARLAEEGATRLIVAHVLEWSPYSFLSAQELAERHKRREEELGRAREALVAPVLRDLAARGIDAEAEIRYGHVAETLAEIARETGAESIVVGRTGSAGMASRLFGSVAVTLAQIAPVPLTIVP